MSEPVSSTESSSCSYCGTSVAREKRYCGSGCDIADRVPRGEEALPASTELGVGLGFCFLFFNHLLFLSLAWLKGGGEDLEMANKLLMVACVFGALVSLSSGFSLGIVRCRSAFDWVCTVMGVALLVVGYLQSGTFFSIDFQIFVLLCNLLVFSWLSRGFVFRTPVKKAQNQGS